MNTMFSKILSYAIIGITMILTILSIVLRRSKQFDTVVFDPNMLLYISYTLCILVVAGVVFGVVLNAMTNPKSLLVPAVSVIVLVILFVITYFSASNETYGKPLPIIDAGLSQFIGGILSLTYVLMGLAFGAIIFAWGRRVIR